KATDPARGLPTDLRDLFENGQWGLAIGDLDDIEPALKVDVASKGKLWAQDYAPYVMGVFLTADRRTAHEISWGWAYDNSVCGTAPAQPQAADAVKLPASTLT